VIPPRAGTADLPVVRTRAAAADWVALCKPRLNGMVVATAFGGAWLASGGRASAAVLLHASLGTALTACGASALNMVMERHADALMERTRHRPVPAGRVAPAEAALFGAALAAAGLAWLAVGTNLLATLLAAATLAIYLGVYTPLKVRSAANTLVGAVPGALPPVIGWAAAGEGLGEGAWVLFGILYLWQIPHFLSIAWLYREDYRRAGLVMLAGREDGGAEAGRQAVRYAAALLLVSLFPPAVGLAGPWYAAGAALLGLGFAAAARGFARDRSDATARRLLHASLVYVPVLLLLLALDRGGAA
jgi:protoheme IX farnesyltransferase